jgi:hypothetical protein
MHFKAKAIPAFAVAAALMVAGVFSTPPKPASADATTTLLLGAAAIAGVVIYENVQHKQQAANQIVGYTTQGYPVYADGHVGWGNTQTNTTNTASVPTIACTQGQACNGPYTGSVSRRGAANTVYTANTGYNGYGQGTYGSGRSANGNNRRY